MPANPLELLINSPAPIADRAARPTSDAQDRLDGLKARRAELSGEARELQAKRSKLGSVRERAAKAAEALQAQTTALTAEIVEALSADAVSDLPRLNAAEHGKLQTELAQARAEVTAAETVDAQLIERQVALSQCQAALEGEIEAAALEIVAAEFNDVLGELSEFANHVAKLFARAYALRLWLASEGRRNQDNDDQAKALIFFRHAEALASIKLPESVPNNGQVDEQQREWSERYGGLTV